MCIMNTPEDENIYDGIMLYRRIVLSISSLALILNIAFIIKKKHYHYTTIYLFLIAEIFFLISLCSVLTHSEVFSGNNISCDNISDVPGVVEDMIKDNAMIGCSLESFVNLVAYNISYLFSVILTFCVTKLLKDTQKNLIRRHRKQIMLLVGIIILIFTFPLVLSFIPGVPYSFGPTGFYFGQENIFSGEFKYYLTYCGLVNRDNDWGILLVNVTMSLFGAFLFFVHLFLLCKNYYLSKVFLRLEGISPIQIFVVKSVIFVVQALNYFKLILQIVQPEEKQAGWIGILIVLNSLFDFGALILVISYGRFYRNSKTLQFADQARSESLLSLP